MRRTNIKETIQEASMQYLSEYGCKFSIDDMVKSLDMSKRTFYRYFASKEVLLMSLVDLVTKEVQETMKAIYEDESLHTDEKLLRALTIETNFEKAVSFRRIPELETYYPTVYQYLLQQYERDWSVAEKLLRQGMEKGIYKEHNIELIKNLLQNGMQMLCKDDFLEKSGMTYQEGLHQVVQIILAGIRKEAQEGA